MYWLSLLIYPIALNFLFLITLILIAEPIIINKNIPITQVPVTPNVPTTAPVIWARPVGGSCSSVISSSTFTLSSPKFSLTRQSAGQVFTVTPESHYTLPHK